MVRSLALGFLLLAGCQRTRDAGAPLRLGYFPNLTHAQALVADQEGAFAKALGLQKLEIRRFNAGPSAMEALLAGELDVTYVGSGPAINAFVRSHGNLKVIAGAASGGAELIAKTARTPSDLRGKRVASPQLGNSQDIALRYWLNAQGFKVSRAGGGDVIIMPVANPDILTLFRRGEIEAAWVPEPWGARLIAEGGHILVDERTLWPDGRFPTTLLVASERALKARRNDLRAIVQTHVAITERGRAQPKPFFEEANAAFGKITGKPLAPAILSDAASRIELTVDPMARQLAVAASHAAELGVIPRADVSGLVDPSLLAEIAPRGGTGTAPAPPPAEHRAPPR